MPARGRSGFRVRLARPKIEDMDEVLALHRASRSFHRGRVSPPLTPVQFRRYLARCERPDFVGLLIRRREDDAIVGAVEMSQIARGGFQSAYLGYHLGAPFAGQGYMSEALQLAMRHAFRVLKLHRLEANIQALEPSVDRSREAARVPARGLLPVIPQGVGPMARPRALGDPERGLDPR